MMMTVMVILNGWWRIARRGPFESATLRDLVLCRKR
jgi:hypothetical protein